MTRVLLIGGAPTVRSALAAAFRAAGFSIRAAHDGASGERHLEEFRPDLVLLDPRLPDRNALELARAITSVGRTGVVLIGSSDGTDDKVAGLRVADDYVTTFAHPSEVVARGRAIVRRLRGGTMGTLTFADVVLDEEAHEVTRAGTSVEMTPKEFELLRFFMLNPRRVLSKGQILAAVWGSASSAEEGTVQTYVGYLRRKLDALGPPVIHTVRSFGYVLREPGAA
jgi:two-component system OmpR family response regulator